MQMLVDYGSMSVNILSNLHREIYKRKKENVDFSPLLTNYSEVISIYDKI